MAASRTAPLVRPPRAPTRPRGGTGRTQAPRGRRFCRPAVRRAIQSAALAPSQRGGLRFVFSRKEHKEPKDSGVSNPPLATFVSFSVFRGKNTAPIPRFPYVQRFKPPRRANEVGRFTRPRHRAAVRPNFPSGAAHTSHESWSAGHGRVPVSRHGHDKSTTSPRD